MRAGRLVTWVNASDQAQVLNGLAEIAAALGLSGAVEAITLARDAAADNDPAGLCRGLLNLVSLLSDAGIARALLYAAGEQGLLRNIDGALGRLASASLLTFSTDDTTVAAHRLTMLVAVELKPRLVEIGDDGNSHSPYLPAYERMLGAYMPIYEDSARGKQGTPSTPGCSLSMSSSRWQKRGRGRAEVDRQPPRDAETSGA